MTGNTFNDHLTGDDTDGPRPTTPRLALHARRSIVIAALGLAAITPATALGVSSSWARQFGTRDGDHAAGIDADPGGYTIVGDTTGVLAGRNYGGTDAWIRRYDTRGDVVWTRQFGTPYDDQPDAVSADARGITVVGTTTGRFGGTGGTPGIKDIFVRRYAFDGRVLWTKQLGTSGDEERPGVAGDESGITVVGTVDGALGGPSHGKQDGFIRRYDHAGRVLWSRQFGTRAADFASAVAADANGVTIHGHTYGSLARPNTSTVKDAYLRRYDRAGNLKWTRQFGQPGDEIAGDVVADATGITAVGHTRAKPTWEVLGDGYIRRYDFAGNLKWERLIGPRDSEEMAWGVAADSGGLTVTGYTGGSLEGPSRGSYEIFVRRYDRSGRRTWGTQIGTSSAEIAMGVAAYGSSFAIVAHTTGSLAGPNRGEADVFVKRFVR